jgi:Protein of unknown function (DUF3572)
MSSPPRKRHLLSHEEAEALAIDTLSFLAEDPNRLAGFLRATGLSIADVRSQAGSAEFLAGVLDFVAADESLLLVFASERRIDPATVMAARRSLLPNAMEY